MLKTFALSIVGCDEPGIIASIARVLLDLDCNLADANMSVLSGRFAMVLMVEAPEGMAAARIERELAQVSRRFRLSLNVQELSEEPLPRYFALGDSRGDRTLITIYGADRPGIVHGATDAVAALGGNITDLRTQCASGIDRQPLYSLFLEVQLPEGRSRDELSAVLSGLSSQFTVQVQVQNVGAADL